jgi:xylulokinase
MPLLGIDLGTSAVKALLIEEDGRVLASASYEYPMLTPKPHWTEQHAPEWWTHTVKAIRSVLAKAGVKGDAVRSIGLTGQMHGLTLMDKSGNVLRPAILWNDQRTAAEVHEMIAAVGGSAAAVRKHLTNRPNPSYSAPKLLWVRKHEPGIYKRTVMVLMPKDYIRYKLSGAYASEVTDATGVALFDIKKRTWSKHLLDLFEIDPAIMPPSTESHVVSAQVSAAAAAETGLKAGTPIVGGGGDVATAALGAGAVREGIVMVIIGTSAVLCASIDQYHVIRGGLETFCHAVPGKWHYMSVMLSGGGSLRWYRDTLARGDRDVNDLKPGVEDKVYETILAGAERTPPGAEGLMFVPYLIGERTPHQNPKARGAFVGMTLAHTPQHFTRAVVEGVGMGLRDSLQLMREAGLNVSEVRLTGGAARNAFWRQTLADTLNARITTLSVTEGGAYGVALLAGVGVGHWRDIVEACDALLKPSDLTTPIRARRALYDDMYGVYRQLYSALKMTYR